VGILGGILVFPNVIRARREVLGSGSLSLAWIVYKVRYLVLCWGSVPFLLVATGEPKNIRGLVFYVDAVVFSYETL